MNQAVGRIDKFGNILHPDVIVPPPAPPSREPEAPAPAPAVDQTANVENKPSDQEK